MTTWINVNKHVIARNARTGENNPPIRISKGKRGKPLYAHEIETTGPVRVVYDAEKPVLPCGARLAIATESEVKVLRWDLKYPLRYLSIPYDETQTQQTQLRHGVRAQGPHLRPKNRIRRVHG